jgi:prephenate dehydrogenase
MPENFVPAHPIAGKEKSGVDAADGVLFNNKLVILTPTKNTNAHSVTHSIIQYTFAISSQIIH